MWSVNLTHKHMNTNWTIEMMHCEMTRLFRLYHISFSLSVFDHFRRTDLLRRYLCEQLVCWNVLHDSTKQQQMYILNVFEIIF